MTSNFYVFGKSRRLCRRDQKRGEHERPQAAPVAPAAPAASDVTSAKETAAGKADAAKARWLEVKSPMVGTYYSAPEPGAKPYLTVGDRISKGQILCIIEAMKIMNEIESEFDGVVKEILAQNSHPVEYGQVLFRIDTNG
ncbi:MAG TPA: acetyl-CoA carboxylase biotin carboxyl carrier protein [Gemmatimonadaceae bacterium]|nr:acetyl-CoA carboxylase biotin carboxyl carrier protein [Gemmatimonadaceae bacterium]